MIAAASPHVYHVPEWGDATLIEIVWTVLGTVGVAVTFASLVYIARDRRIFYSGLEMTIDQTRREAAHLLWRSHLLREAGRVFQMSIVLSIGVWAVGQPPLVRPSVTTITGLIITFGFFVWAAFTIVQSYADGYVRRRITSMLNGGEE